jgi:hypothetical protein
MTAPRYDVIVENHGTLFRFVLLTEPAREWVDNHVLAHDWMWMGNGLCVEHHYAADLARGMAADGLTLH